MSDHFDEVRRRAHRARMQPKPPRRPRASTDGGQARHDGYGLHENPYARHEPEHAEWIEAWKDAGKEVK